LIRKIFFGGVYLGKNRDRLSIIAAVLEAANSGARKTRIMFTANLSFSLLEKYLEVVSNVGFVQVDNSKYRLTDPGKEFLRQYQQFHEKYDRVQKLAESLGPERERLARLCQRYGLDNSVESIIDAK
jgi:predicted transcriptional regulator